MSEAGETFSRRSAMVKSELRWCGLSGGGAYGAVGARTDASALPMHAGACIAADRTAIDLPVSPLIHVGGAAERYMDT